MAEGLESSDTKPFWRYVKSKRQDTVGISSLKKNGTLYSDPRDKSDILNNQFKSVFTEPQTPGSDIPRLQGEKFPSIAPLVISVNGVQKLLDKLNIKKASGPDNICCRILRELSAELAPVLTSIYNQSLESGEIPTDWSQALVAPIFKKGSHHLAENYRPVSLTSVPCKLM